MRRSVPTSRPSRRWPQLATVGVYAAGPQALARRDRVIDSLAEMLAPGFEENPAAPKVSAEAIAATVYALMREQVRSEGPREPRRRSPARHLHHPGHLRRPRAGLGGGKRRARVEAVARNRTRGPKPPADAGRVRLSAHNGKRRSFSPRLRRLFVAAAEVAPRWALILGLPSGSPSRPGPVRARRPASSPAGPRASRPPA